MSAGMERGRLRDSVRLAECAGERREPRTGLPCALLFVCLLLAACGDQVQTSKPPEKSSPALPTGHPEIGRGAAADRGGAAEKPDPFQEAGTSQPAMAKAPAPDPERVVYAGEISIDPGVKLGETYTVYVTTVYTPQDRVGVLIKRYETPKFPFRFELKEQDAVMGDRKFERPLHVRAMISDTGDAMKNRNKTTSEQAYPAFTKDVKLTIK